MCKRTKFRGSPKALITRDKTETSYLTQLITEGIVISLKILAIGMGNRGSKSAIDNSIAVKEQRVDGSSVFIIL
ncbi:MAG: hypothetical protein O7C62_08955 [Rickettsia endosymbiont of Ixodes persulcatus]|jgi:hypothetical protein|nr:hypothetical protein [Rickettsia endosymbiont of Ixodes persulcatus]